MTLTQVEKVRHVTGHIRLISFLNLPQIGKSDTRPVTLDQIMQITASLPVKSDTQPVTFSLHTNTPGTDNHLSIPGAFFKLQYFDHVMPHLAGMGGGGHAFIYEPELFIK